MMSPQIVADAFVPQYYGILEKSAENMHKFYKETSSLGWPGLDGQETLVSGLTGIQEKIMASDFKNCSVEIEDVAAQESLEGGIIIVVTAVSTGKDDVKMKLHQTFFLAKQSGGGFFVRNDILRFSRVCEPITNSVINEDDKQEHASSVSDAVPSAVTQTPISYAKAVGEHENARVAKEAADLPVRKDIDTKVTAAAPSVVSHDRETLVLEPASEAKTEAVKQTVVAKADVAKVEVAKVQVEKVEVAKAEVAKAEVAKAEVAKAEVVKAEVPKLSYASMVAKESPLTSPKALKVSAPVNKPVAPRVDPATKRSTPSVAVPKAAAPQNNFAPKSPVASNGAKTTPSEARGIYIGGLPYEVTKQGVAEAMKKFGHVRRSADSIQIRKHEDGFCCGFVEFETGEGARRAVQAHHVKIGDKEAYITYKKSYRGNNDGRGRSPTRGGYQNGNFRANENGEAGNKQRSHSGNRTGYNNNGGHAKGGAPRQNRPSEEWQRNGRQRDGSNPSAR